MLRAIFAVVALMLAAGAAAWPIRPVSTICSLPQLFAVNPATPYRSHRRDEFDKNTIRRMHRSQIKGTEAPVAYFQ